MTTPDWHHLKSTKTGPVCILGTGPSLIHQLEEIGFPTIGVTFSYKVHRSPNFHVALDLYDWKDSKDLSVLAALGTLVFGMRDRLHPGQDSSCLCLWDSAGDNIGWSWDITKGIYPRCSIYAAMQLAVWLGYDEIYLLGVDPGDRRHAYGGPGPKRLDWDFQARCFAYGAEVLRGKVPVHMGIDRTTSL